MNPQNVGDPSSSHLMFVAQRLISPQLVDVPSCSLVQTFMVFKFPCPVDSLSCYRQFSHNLNDLNKMLKS